MSFPWTKRPVAPPPPSPPEVEEEEWEGADDGGGSGEDEDEDGAAAAPPLRPLASHPLSEGGDEAGVSTRGAKTKAVSQRPPNVRLPPTPVLATALAALLLSVVSVATRRRRRGRRAAPPPPPSPTARRRRRRRPAVVDMQAPAVDVSGWVEPVAGAPEPSPASGPLTGARVVVVGAPTPALPSLLEAGATLVGATPDPADAGVGPVALEGTPQASRTPNSAAPAGGAALAGTGARAAACLAARAADLALAPSPPTGLPAALASAVGLAALRTADATLLAADVATLPAAAVAAGLAPPARRPPDAPATTLIIVDDLFDGCWGEPACVAALPAAARAASVAWASPAMVASADLVPFLASSVPSAARFVSAEEWEGGAVLRGLRRAAGVLAGEEALDDGPAPPPAAAAAVAREAADAMARAVAGGRVLVLPSLPGPHPPGGGGEGDAAPRAAWSAGVRGLGALVALSGLPSVSLPVPSRPFPASVTLLGGPGSAATLLSAAVRLGPLLAREWGPALDRARTAISQAAAGLAAEAAAGGGAAPTSPSPSAASAATAVASPPSPAAATSAAPPRPAAASTAATLRAGGNAAFRAGDFAGAVEAYSAAIAADPACHLALSNRAAAHLSLLRFEDAEADATASLRLRTTPKALLRRAAARRGLGDVPGARADLRTVLQLEPGNAQARSDLAALQAAEEAGYV